MCESGDTFDLPVTVAAAATHFFLCCHNNRTSVDKEVDGRSYRHRSPIC